MKIVSPYTYPHNWLKSNFHTHTTRSDGSASVQEVVAMYRDDNYDVLALTDHHKLSVGDEKGAGKMLLLPGQECHIPDKAREFQYHVVGLGLSRQVERQNRGQKLIDAVVKAGGIAIVGHPRWSWMSYEQFDGLKGYVAFEVYNGACEKMVERGFSVDYWDHWMTRFRKPLYAVGVDDMHSPQRDFGMGWTYVNAAKTSDAVIDALRRGDMYATNGPRIETIRTTARSITVHTSAAKAIKFRKSDGWPICVVEGENLKSATYNPKGNEGYIRVEVHARDGRIAWSNPLMIEP